MEKQVSELQIQAAAASVIDVEPVAAPKLPTIDQDKAVSFDVTAAIDEAAANVDADKTKGAIEKATDAMKNVASQITNAITSATDTAETDAEAAKADMEAKIETAGGRKSRRRRRRGQMTRR